tara:strand:- start:151 stop:369 length:219 start_codon:yes stop_codon:yes gene_type:complete
VRAASQERQHPNKASTQIKAVAHSVPNHKNAKRASFISMFHDHTVRRRMGFWREELRCKTQRTAARSIAPTI